MSISNEVSKGLIDLWRGRTASFLELVLFGIMFLVLTYAIGRGTLQPALVAPLTVGFVAYLFFHMQTNRLFWGLLGEIQSGTLEQLYLSPLPPWMLTAGLTSASIVEAAITALLLLLGVRLVTPVTIPLHWAAVVPLALLVLASVGYSLILGGLTLRFRRIEILKELFQLVVLIFGGVFISLDRLPGWMADIARVLPLTPGVETLRKTLLDGVPLATLAKDGTLLWLIGNAAAYLVLGIAVFRWCELLAKREGTLGQY
jgi:ABC-type polysaccharide/polyol phosphate export permease